jgi:hypothetical protein
LGGDFGDLYPKKKRGGFWRQMDERKKYPNSNLDVRVWSHWMGHGTCILENQYKSIRILVKKIVKNMNNNNSTS